MSSRSVPLLFLTAALLSGCTDSSSPAAEDRLPEGRWHLAPRSASNELQDVAEQERAQLLSMPYLSGSVRATDGDEGVVAWAPDHSWGSHNLYTSGHGPDVLLMRSDGTYVHRWRLPFERAFPDRPTSVETPFFRRAHLLPGGDLIAIYQGGGIVRLDADAEIVWKLAGGFFNDFFVADDESVWALTKTARRDRRSKPRPGRTRRRARASLDRDGEGSSRPTRILDMLLAPAVRRPRQGGAATSSTRTPCSFSTPERHEPFETGTGSSLDARDLDPGRGGSTRAAPWSGPKTGPVETSA